MAELRPGAPSIVQKTEFHIISPERLESVGPESSPSPSFPQIFLCLVISNFTKLVEY